MSSPFDDLLLSDEFQSLLRREETFNPFKVLRVHRKELAHSNLLAFFFNPSSAHGCGNAIVKAFLQGVVSLKDAGFTLSEFLGIDFSEVVVRREHLKIDLVLEFPQSKTVIAIENKVDAAEGGKQIERYQQKIEDNYAHYDMCKILFLTPKGSASNTVDPVSCVDCVPVSYRSVLNALESSEHLVAANVTDFFQQTLSHIKETILSEGPQQQLIKDIWANPEYAETLQEIFEHRPNLDSIFDAYKQKVIQLLDSEFNLTPEFISYPEKRGKTKEIRFRIKEWNEKGLPLSFMLYQYDHEPAFRILVHKNHYHKYETELVDFAQSTGDLPSDKRFSPLKGWSAWRRFYLEDDYPDSSWCDQVVCNHKTLEWAVERVVEHVNTLKTSVDEF